MRNLRLLTPNPPQPASRRRSAVNGLFGLAVLAILSQSFLGYSVMHALGVPAEAVTLHPATVLLIVGGLWALCSGVPFRQRCRDAPGLVLFLAVLPALAAYKADLAGPSAGAFYLETYWAPGLLVLMLEPASPTQKRLLGRLLLAVCVLNALVALLETITESTWFPVIAHAGYVAATDTGLGPGPNAFFDHRLTASLVIGMAIYLLYAMRVRFILAAPVFGILLAGLLACGGGTAFSLTVILTLVVACRTLASGIARRNLSADFVLAMVTGTVTLCVLMILIIGDTGVGDHILDAWSFDAPTLQWDMLARLNLQDWLFGMSPEDLGVLVYQVDLGGRQGAVESFWTFMLLDLGVIGFVMFIAAFGGLLYHLWRTSRGTGAWLVLVAAAIIESPATALGARSNDLLFVVAFVIAISGYRGYIRQPVPATRPVSQRLRPPQTHAIPLEAVPAIRARGLGLLPSPPA